MIANNLKDKSVLVTGGTRGLGKAIGIEFARVGAQVFLTHKWGSIDDTELMTEFQSENLPPPHILESDVGDLEDMRSLMTTIKQKAGALDVIISNVSFAKIINNIEDYKKNSFDLSLKYSTWPIVDLIQTAYEVIGQFPRYVIAVSSCAADMCYKGYDMSGPSKAALESLCRYLALQLKSHGVRVNAVRPWYTDTASLRAAYSENTIDRLKKYGLLLNPKGTGEACVALCSGWMDSVTGQILATDEGWSLVNPVSYITGDGLPKDFPQNQT